MKYFKENFRSFRQKAFRKGRTHVILPLSGLFGKIEKNNINNDNDTEILQLRSVIFV